MPKLNFRYDVRLPVMILQEGKRFVAYTPALDLSTSGKTQKQAKEHFGEALHVFLEELADAGTIDGVLKGLGWRKVKAQWQAPKIVSHSSERIVIPA